VAPGGRLSSGQAAARLRVKPATLYAYVSRGLLSSERAPDGRTSSFDPEEVERLARRSRRREPRGPAQVVVESGLTAIQQGRLWYRGLDAAELARARSFEAVATWLWTGAWPGPTEAAWRADPAALATARACQAGLPAATLPLDRLRVVAAALAAADELRFELHPEAVVATGQALLAGLVDALPAAGPGWPGTGQGAAEGGPPGGVAGRLWRRLCPSPPGPGMVEALDAALVLVADHELAASTLAARVAASVDADPYAVVLAGLGVLSGAKHGGASLAVETLLAGIGRPGDAARAVGDRLRRGERVPGLGHPLYPDGDPRAAVLLGLAGDLAAQQQAGGRATGPDRLAVVQAVLATLARRRLPPPNLDFGLAALVEVTGMVRGAGEAVFAVGRVAGWLAHALEEYERQTPIRPRAAYTGPPPGG
jgi:citrate synthase